MNCNGELTETENVIFYVSYGVTEFLRNFYGYGNGYGNGYVTVEIRHYCDKRATVATPAGH